jgi:hypothetical protein
MKLTAIYSLGLGFGTLAVFGLSACQKEGMQPTTTAGLSKSALTVGLPPVITWWSSVAAIAYTGYPGDAPAGEMYSVGFTINGKGYVLGGMLDLQRGDAKHVPDLWMFDLATQAWGKQAPYPGSYGDLVGEQIFVIGDNAYVMQDSVLWQYNQPLNQWTTKAAFPGKARFYGTAMAINGKGYVGIGVDDITILNLKDWWQYDPTADHWTQMHDFGGDPRQQAVGFSIDGKGYVCWGLNNQDDILRPVWQYDPVADSWTKRQNCPAPDAFAASTGTIGGVDVGLMTDGADLWQYNPALDSWSDQGAVRYGDHAYAAGFVINDSYFLANISVSAYNWSR